MIRHFLTSNSYIFSGKYGVTFLLFQEKFDWLTDTIKTIFSWVILMPISVIISGKLLSQPFRLTVGPDEFFTVPIPKILFIRATGSEVIFGFTGFIITLLLLGLLAGPSAYVTFRSRFGLDPGQFNSLCILSSFITVIWSTMIWLVFTKLHKARRIDLTIQERDRLIEELAQRALTRHDPVAGPRTNNEQ